MRKKLKYKFIFLLVIVLIVSLFFSTSCEAIYRIFYKLKEGEAKSVEEAYEKMGPEDILRERAEQLTKQEKKLAE